MAAAADVDSLDLTFTENMRHSSFGGGKDEKQTVYQALSLLEIFPFIHVTEVGLILGEL